MFQDDDIMKFIRQVKQSGLMCLPNKMKFYAPIRCGDDDNPKHNCTKLALKLRDDLNTIFGGSTMWAGEGSWYNAKTREVVVEPVKGIEVAHNCTDVETAQKMAKAVTDYAVSAKQHSISIERGSFYIMSTPEMAEASKKFTLGDETKEKWRP